MIENLKRENRHLNEKLNIQEQDVKVELFDKQNSSISVTNGIEASELTCAETQVSEKDDLEISEPFKKLESRFKEAMEKVAELTDDKQRLEHLVLQLQGETETIGKIKRIKFRLMHVLQKRFLT